MELTQLVEDEESDQVQIVAIAPESIEDAQKVRAELGDKAGRLLLLSDPNAKVIKRYGILNDESRRNLPHPTTLVIDGDGKVRWRYTEVDYKVRPSNQEIRDALRSAGLR